MKYLKLVFLLAVIATIISCSDDSESNELNYNNGSQRELNALHIMSSGSANATSRNGGDPEDEGDSELDFIDSCFVFVFPIDVVLPDGSTVQVNSEDELEAILIDWEENAPDTAGYPELVFPLTISVDGQDQVISTEDELCEIIEECYMEYDYYEEDYDDFEDFLDDEFDFEECFDIVFPVQITFPDGSTTTASSDEELDRLFEQWEEDNPESEAYPEITFPVSIIIDGTEVEVTSEEQLCEIMADCYDDFGDYDEEFEECFTFIFPLSFTLPDGSTVNVNSEEEIDELFESLENGDPENMEYPTLNFPVSILLNDEEVEINSEEELDKIWDDCYEEYEDDEDDNE